MLRYEVQRLSALLILDVIDTYADALISSGGPVRPQGALTFTISPRPAGAGGGAPEDALEMIVRPNDSGYRLFFGKVWQFDGGSRTRRRFVPGPGNYTLSIVSELYQPLSLAVDFSQRDARVPLELKLTPGSAYPFDDISPVHADAFARLGPGDSIRPRLGATLLRGTLRDRNGTPVEGATIRGTSPPPVFGISTVSDERGEWYLLFPESLYVTTGTIRVSIERPGGVPAINVAGVDVAQGRASSLLQTSLAGQVQELSGVAAAGAQVQVTNFPGGVTTGADGRWTYVFDPGKPALSTTTVEVEATLGDRSAKATVPIRPRLHNTVPTLQLADAQ